MGLLFEGGDYSRAASDQGNTVHADSFRWEDDGTLAPIWRIFTAGTRGDGEGGGGTYPSAPSLNPPLCTPTAKAANKAYWLTWSYLASGANRKFEQRVWPARLHYILRTNSKSLHIWPSLICIRARYARAYLPTIRGFPGLSRDLGMLSRGPDLVHWSRDLGFLNAWLWCYNKSNGLEPQING